MRCIQAGSRNRNRLQLDLAADGISSIRDTEEFPAGINLADFFLRGRKERLGIINENSGIIPM